MGIESGVATRAFDGIFSRANKALEHVQQTAPADAEALSAALALGKDELKLNAETSTKLAELQRKLDEKEAELAKAQSTLAVARANTGDYLRLNNTQVAETPRWDSVDNYVSRYQTYRNSMVRGLQETFNILNR